MKIKSIKKSGKPVIEPGENKAENIHPEASEGIAHDEESGETVPEDPESIEEFIKLKKLQNTVLNKMLEKIKNPENQDKKSTNK